jgi:hypothetical protein
MFRPATACRITSRPRLEGLEERLVPDTNYWIANAIPPGQTAASWDVDTNWSLGTHPNRGQDIVFDSAHSDIPAAAIPTGDIIAKLASLTFGDWGGSLTVPVTFRPQSSRCSPAR